MVDGLHHGTLGGVSLSSALVASSSTSTSGPWYKARAMPMRWRCPPDSRTTALPQPSCRGRQPDAEPVARAPRSTARHTAASSHTPVGQSDARRGRIRRRRRIQRPPVTRIRSGVASRRPALADRCRRSSRGHMSAPRAPVPDRPTRASPATGSCPPANHLRLSRRARAGRFRHRRLGSAREWYVTCSSPMASRSRGTSADGSSGALASSLRSRCTDSTAKRP